VTTMSKKKNKLVKSYSFYFYLSKINFDLLIQFVSEIRDKKINFLNIYLLI